MADVARLPAEKSLFQIPTDEQITHAITGYETKDKRRNAIFAFLREYPFLLPVLAEARPKISEYFGESATPTLMVSADPETENCRMLWVDILADSSADEVEQQEERFAEEWWLHRMPQTDGLLEFDPVWREEE